MFPCPIWFLIVLNLLTAHLFAIPYINDPGKCPSEDLTLVSNQIYNMSEISNFFGVLTAICGSLHNSWNVYKGSRPEQKNITLPFIEHNFSTAQIIGGFYIVYYTEFVLTCRSDPQFKSDDFNVCPHKKCNTEKPFVSILMDINVAGLEDQNNQVFRKLENQPNCTPKTTNTDNQCPAETPNSCSTELEPCCYSKKCIFPFSQQTDQCPGFPIESDGVLAIHMMLACNADNHIYGINKPNPVPPKFFVWDLDAGEPETSDGELLVGRGTLKLTEQKELETLFWFAEFRFDTTVFSGCLTDILTNVDSNKVPSFLKTLKI